MTEMMIREDRTAVETYNPIDIAPAGVMRLADWAQEARAAHDLATMLCRTSFAPAHFRGKPEETAAAILTGNELGMSPMSSMRSIFIINGTPGMYAKSMVAVAQSRGHKVWIAEQSPERVVVKGTRRGEPEEYVTVWDLARVKTADLMSNAQYRKNPQAMMVARGQAEISRQVASDALHGIPYAVEELDDFPPVVEPRRRLTAAEVMADAPVSAVVVEGRDEDEPEAPARAAAMITKDQSTKLHATLGDLGLGGKANRDNALAKISLILRHDIDTTAAMTKTEASHVIDVLDQELRRKRNADAAKTESLPHEWTIDDLFRAVGLGDDGPAQLRYACEVIGRSVGRLDELTEPECRTLTQRLANWMASETPPAGDES